MSMKNRMAFRERAKVKQIINRAVEIARAPGGGTHGTASTGGSVISGDLIANTRPDDDGNTLYPFLLGVDTPDDEFAFTLTGYPTRNYQN